MQRRIRRGDIFYVGGGHATDGEQGANRPAVIVSNDIGNRYAPIVEIVYLTTQNKRNLPTHVHIKSSKRPSIVLCEQVTTVSKRRLERWLGHVTAKEMQEINRAIKRSLALDGRRGR